MFNAAILENSKMYKILCIFLIKWHKQKIQKDMKSAHFFFYYQVIVVDLYAFFGRLSTTLNYTKILVKMSVFEKKCLMKGSKYQYVFFICLITSPNTSRKRMLSFSELKQFKCWKISKKCIFDLLLLVTNVIRQKICAEALSNRGYTVLKKSLGYTAYFTIYTCPPNDSPAWNL